MKAHADTIPTGPIERQGHGADLSKPIEPLPIVRKHHWDIHTERRIAACEFVDGNGRTIRVCDHCKISKITVHPPHGYPWNEWLHPNAKVPFKCSGTPPCQGRG